MTLQIWLRKCIIGPHKIIAIFMFAGWSLFAARSYFSIQTKQQTFVRQTADLLSTAIQQQNRVMAESLLETLVSQGNASSAEICNGKKQELGSNRNLMDCGSDNDFSEHLVEQKIPGSGTLVLRAKFNILKNLYSVFWGLGFALFMVFCGFYLIQSIQKRIKKDLFEPLLNKLLGDETLLIKELMDLRNTIQKVKQLEAQKVATLAIQNNNKQVAHDIRSPLSALNMVIGSVADLPEEKRLIIKHVAQRINDIANGLLHQSKATELVPSPTHVEPVMLIGLLDSIVSEKRVQYRSQIGIEIQADLQEGYGLFAKINAGEFSRVISNLINNAVESFSDNQKNSGHVTVAVCKCKEMIEITIRDNGQGMSSEVLKRLGERGFSYGKEGGSAGSGLGVAHARETVQGVGGEFAISSLFGHGTLVSIRIPRTETPSWFLKQFEIDSETILVSADDDQTIHQIWRRRLGLLSDAPKVRHFMFSSLNKFEEWLVHNKTLPARYLIDYEFFGQSGNGLDLVERLGIEKNSVLVTSRFEEKNVREHSARLGVQILPKALAAFVPFLVHPSKGLDELQSQNKILKMTHSQLSPLLS